MATLIEVFVLRLGTNYHRHLALAGHYTWSANPSLLKSIIESEELNKN